MSLMLKVFEGIGVAFLIVCSICVTLAALYPPKDPKGKSESQKDD